MMLLFRLMWGFVGPNYATFKTFTLSLKELQSYFAQKIYNRWRTIHAGHNAASSWFTLIVLFLGGWIVLSGLFLQGIQEGSGVFKELNEHYFRFSFALLTFHKLFSYTLLAWAMIHIIGVFIEQFYHQTDMFFAMMTGYKKAEGNDATISIMQHLFAYGMIGVSIVLVYCVALDDAMFLTQSRFEKHDFKLENPAFFEQCGKCHKTYPPFMLPSDSWARLMDGLDNHFGEHITEQNITTHEQIRIKSYLLSHSAEHSTHKVAFKTLNSLGSMRPISMRKVPYWRETHQNMDKDAFNTLHVKNAANCFACHPDFEYGILDMTRVRIPKVPLKLF